MSHIFAIAKKELRLYFNSPMAYIFIVVFLVLSSWLFFRQFFINGQADMRAFFSMLPWIFLFLIPAITMKMWAEEKKTGTMEILLTFPVKDYEVVIGKFLATVLFLAITLLCSLIIPIIIGYLGDPDGGVIFTSYVGAILMGASYLAIGLWTSSLTNNQIVAFILAVVVCFAFYIIGDLIVTAVLPDMLVPVFQYLGLANHYSSIARGVIDSRDIIYYTSFIFFFLYLNSQSIASRKWK